MNSANAAATSASPPATCPKRFAVSLVQGRKLSGEDSAMASTTSSYSGGGGFSLRLRSWSSSPSTTPSEAKVRLGSSGASPSLASAQPPWRAPPSGDDSLAMSSSIGSRSATATSAGSATSIRVEGATTVTLLKTVVPVATALPPLGRDCSRGNLYRTPVPTSSNVRKSPSSAGQLPERGITV